MTTVLSPLCNFAFRGRMFQVEHESANRTAALVQLPDGTYLDGYSITQRRVAIGRVRANFRRHVLGDPVVQAKRTPRAQFTSNTGDHEAIYLLEAPTLNQLSNACTSHRYVRIVYVDTVNIQVRPTIMMVDRLAVDQVPAQGRVRFHGRATDWPIRVLIECDQTGITALRQEYLDL
jgi:hypothetical protein